MATHKRDLWLKHPKIKEAANAKLGAEVNRPKPRNAYSRVITAIANQSDWSMDTLRFDRVSNRLEWEFNGVDLIGTNTLLRFHQAKVNSYRQQWKQRTAALIYQHRSVINKWHGEVEYPIRYEVAYLTSHNTTLDEDNLVGAAKVVLDEIVRQTPIPDDSPEYIRYPLAETALSTCSKLMMAMYPVLVSPVSEATHDWIRQQDHVLR